MTSPIRNADPAARLPVVSRFEANLLRVLRFFLGQVPAEQALPLLAARQEPPPCLRAAAVALVRDSLGKGCVRYLARSGGWRRERFLRGSEAVEGRLWERWPVSERTLSFSRHTLAFLIWATAARQPETKGGWQTGAHHLTPADQLLLFLAYAAVRDTDAGLPWRTRQPFNRIGLCRLAFPEDFGMLPANAVPDFAPWLHGLGAAVLEALQPILAARWLQIERRKGQIGDWQTMRQLGQSQESVLTAFLTAAEAARRPDLARFVLQAAAALLPVEQVPTFWFGGLQGTGPPRLAERLETQRSALAFLRQVERLQAWQRRARSVGYFDEDYAQSQLWKADWEAHGGDAVAARAHNALRQLEPLNVIPNP